MEIRIHYRHISHGENSSEDIKGWLTDFFNRTAHVEQPSNDNRELSLDVYFSKARVRDGSAKAAYECHMLARAPWLKKDLFAKAIDDEFWSAMTETSHLLKNQIVKDRAQLRASRHNVQLNNLSGAEAG